MTRPDHVPQIDALRGLAAMVVAFVFHQHLVAGVYRTGPLDGLPVFTWLHDYGWTMVDLFFVISGFVMCHVYLGVPGERRPPPSALRFANARFARLYPLHFVTLLATAAILAVGVPASYQGARPDGWNFALNALMLQQSPLAEGMSFNLPAWSIAVEMYCYAAFYLLIRFAPRWLPRIAPAVVAGALLATIPDGELTRNVARGLCGFFAGVLVWRWGRAVPVWLLPWPGLAALWFLDDVEGVNKGSLLALTLYPALVLAALRAPWLDGPVFRWLGTRSYAIYLLFAPIYWAGALLFFGGRAVPVGAAGEELLVCVAAILIAAHFSYKYLEVPARRWLRMRGAEPHQAALAAA
jgi:peptidoglycan/LPS O-acetylase OafA/YrhL